MKKTISLFTALLTLLLLSSCGGSTKKSSNQEDKTHVEKKDCNHVHWSYHDSATGPSNWANLCEGFSACAGSSQSPVDIKTSGVITDNNLEKPQFNYGQTKTDIINNGHTIQFNVDGNNTVKLNGKEYKLLQFHYHAPSEHTVNGQHYAMEVHFVNKHSDNDYAVLGVMITEGKSNDLFEKFLDRFPKKEGEYKADDLIELMTLLPGNKSYYYYSGSLTTPPCSEVVSWYIFTNPIEASKTQIEKFASILNNNNRPVMPLNGRKIKLFEDK